LTFVSARPLLIVTRGTVSLFLICPPPTSRSLQARVTPWPSRFSFPSCQGVCLFPVFDPGFLPPFFPDIPGPQDFCQGPRHFTSLLFSFTLPLKCVMSLRFFLQTCFFCFFFFLTSCSPLAQSIGGTLDRTDHQLCIDPMGPRTRGLPPLLSTFFGAVPFSSPLTFFWDGAAHEPFPCLTYVPALLVTRPPFLSEPPSPFL